MLHLTLQLTCNVNFCDISTSSLSPLWVRGHSLESWIQDLRFGPGFTSFIVNCLQCLRQEAGGDECLPRLRPARSSGHLMSASWILKHLAQSRCIGGRRWELIPSFLVQTHTAVDKQTYTHAHTRACTSTQRTAKHTLRAHTTPQITRLSTRLAHHASQCSISMHTPHALHLCHPSPTNTRSRVHTFIPQHVCTPHHVHTYHSPCVHTVTHARTRTRGMQVQ